MKSSSLSLSLIALASLFHPAAASACDLCGIYTPPFDLASDQSFVWHVGVASQFTHFGSLRQDGHEISNPLDQHLDSSISQFLVGGSFFDQRLDLQVNVPYIYRSYARAGHHVDQRGDEEGFGDMTLLATYALFRTDKSAGQPSAPSAKGAKNVTPAAVEPRTSGIFNIQAGLKAPTGDSSRLEEELHEHHHDGYPSSGIHGHDLALGSGSWDGVIGAEAFFRRDNLFFAAEVQYSIRSTGDYDYRYANDLMWDFGPGVYFVRDGSRTLALQALVSGEDKGLDTFQGEKAEDTGITFWFVGPRVTASFGRWSAEAGLDIPVSLNTTDIQAVPDYRVHAGVTFRF